MEICVMKCCFMNFHEKENEKNLIAHLDREIDIAIARGCSVFFAGTRYPEDDIFVKRVLNIAKMYAEGEIAIERVEAESEEALKKRLLAVADYEVYPYETDIYPYPDYE